MGNVDMDWLLAGGVVYWPAWSNEYYLNYVTMGANQEAIYGGQDGDVLLGYDQTVVWVDLVKLELVEQSIGGMNGLRMATREECESAGIEYIEQPPMTKCDGNHSFNNPPCFDKQCWHGTRIVTDATFEALRDSFQELNLGNYTDDDVRGLNDWALSAFDAMKGGE